jgi:hypothetical protein
VAIRYEEIKRVPINPHLYRGQQLKVTIDNGEIIISRKVADWENITSCCFLDFRWSQHSEGKYIAIMYRLLLTDTAKLAAVVGIHGMVAQSGFRVEKPEGASVSFQIFKKN